MPAAPLLEHRNADADPPCPHRLSDLTRMDEGIPATAEQAVEFFRRKGADGPCPICRGAKWLLHSGVDRGVDVFRVPRQVDYVVSNLQVYVMICENCGFVRQHVRDLVDGTMNPPSGGLFISSSETE